MKEFWDQRYSTKEYAYGKEPNSRFHSLINELQPGRILLPGEGEGRNAVYAARKGWEVHAVDQSAEGRCKALTLAEESGVVIRYDVGDLTTMALPEGPYDLISLIFVHLPPDVRPLVHQRLAGLLKAGGIIHIVGFSPEQLLLQTGGPRDAALLYTEELLRGDFSDLTQLEFVTIDDTFAEGPYHNGRYRAVEMIGVFNAQR